MHNDDGRGPGEKKNDVIEPEAEGAEGEAGIREQMGERLRVGAVRVKEPDGFTHHGAEHHGGEKRVQSRCPAQAHDERTSEDHPEQGHGSDGNGQNYRERKGCAHGRVRGRQVCVCRKARERAEHDRVTV